MPTNLYGPGDDFDLETSHVLAALLRKAHEAKMSGAGEIIVWGTGTPRREFLHVDDLAAAVLFLIEHCDSPEIINVGCGEDISIRELGGVNLRCGGLRGGEAEMDRSRPDGTPRKLLDISRIKNWLDANDCVADGIARFYEWFLDNYVPANDGEVCDEKMRIGVVGVGHIGQQSRAHLFRTAKSQRSRFSILIRREQMKLVPNTKLKPASLDEFAGMIDAARSPPTTSAHFSTCWRRASTCSSRNRSPKDQRRAPPGTDGCGKRGSSASLGHVERFNPVLSALEQRLTHPRFIEAYIVLHIRIAAREIGVVLDLMIHDLEIILHWSIRWWKISMPGAGVLSAAKTSPTRGCASPADASPMSLRAASVRKECARSASSRKMPIFPLDYQGQSGEIYRRVDGQITREPVAIESERAAAATARFFRRLCAHRW